MSFETVAEIILFGSFLGLGIIIWRKIPVLVKLPETPAGRTNLISGRRIGALKLKEKVRILNFSKLFSGEVFLQKLLSRIRILTLRTDNKTSSWLQKLRESQKKKFKENDNYWDEIKKSTKK